MPGKQGDDDAVLASAQESLLVSTVRHSFLDLPSS